MVEVCLVASCGVPASSEVVGHQVPEVEVLVHLAD